MKRIDENKKAGNEGQNTTSMYQIHRIHVGSDVPGRGASRKLCQEKWGKNGKMATEKPMTNTTVTPRYPQLHIRSYSGNMFQGEVVLCACGAHHSHDAALWVSLSRSRILYPPRNASGAGVPLQCDCSDYAVRLTPKKRKQNAERLSTLPIWPCKHPSPANA